MRPYLQTLALFGCSVYATIPAYWLTLHPFADHWRTRGRDAFRALVPLWILYMLVAALVLFPWRHDALYTTPYAFIPAAILILAGFSLYFVAGRDFTHVQLTGLAELEPGRHDQRLITAGIRARVRHPIYLGHLCELLGWTVAFATTSLIALTAFAVVTGAIMLRLEDRELESRFGDSYAEYRRRVPAMLPKLF